MNRTQGRPAENHLEAVHKLFIRHSSEIRGFILALMTDLSRVDDVFQETFLTVSRKAGDFKLGTNFLGWACTIARFKVKEAYRFLPKGAQPLSEEVIDALCATEPPPEPDEDRLRALAKCLETLPDHTRRAFELRYQQAHEPPEIARRLGWSTGSVYVVLSRARAVLRDCVDKKLAAQNASLL